MKDNRKIRLAGSFVIAALLSTNFYAASFLEPSGFEWWLLPVLTILLLSIWEWASWVSGKLDQRYPWSESFAKRLGLQVFFTCLGAIGIFNIPYSILKLYAVANYGDTYSIYVVLLINSFLLIFCLLITGMQLSIHFLNKWRTSEIDAERLKKETVKAQFDALKNQIDPHFLFNNLNTIYGLIRESPPLASEFLLHLSHMYRYILQNRDREVVQLNQELQLTKSYLFLLQQRSGDSLQVEWNIPDDLSDQLIVPLGLYTLIENAVKHNSIERAQPLCIRISMISDQWIEVRNTMNSRSPVDSTGLGLTQLQKRYRYLSDNEVIIEKTSQYFLVKLPIVTIEMAHADPDR